MWETNDPNGRRVVLTRRSWEHVLVRHPEIEIHFTDVLQAVERPTLHTPGRESHEEWFFLRDAGPSRWLHVVVHFVGSEGSVATAFGRSRLP